MARIPTSPAVVFIETDNSAFAPTIDSSIAGVAGFASKGPTNVATLITSPTQLIDTFGIPKETLPGQGIEGSLELLEATNQLFFARANLSDSKPAQTNLLFGTCPIFMFAAASVASDTRLIYGGGGYGVGSGCDFNVKVYDDFGILQHDNDYVVPSGLATSSEGQAIALQRFFSTSSGIQSFDAPFTIYGGTPDLSGTGVLVGKWSGLLAKVVISPLGEEASLATTVLGYTIAGNGLKSSLSSAYTAPMSSCGAQVSSGSFNYLVQSNYAGDGYNYTKNISTNAITGVSVDVENNPETDDSIITISNDGSPAEKYLINLYDEGKFIEDLIQKTVAEKTSAYVIGRLSNIGDNYAATGVFTRSPSSFSRLAARVTLFDKTTPITTTGTYQVIKLISQSNFLSDGYNGNTTIAGNVLSSILGNSALKTGVHALNDDTLNISLVIAPGFNMDTLDNELISIAESTKDFMVALSPPLGLTTVQQAKDWINGKSNYRKVAINSSYASVTWPWVQVFNTFEGKDKWMDPAIYAVRQMLLTDNVAEAWFAPAGFRRGRLTKPTASEVSLNQGDRDQLYGSNINPIVNFFPEGLTIFGQKTTQRQNTSLDRINIRRLMIIIRKILLVTGREDLFEPNDPFTWDIVKDKCNAFLSNIKSRRGIVDFSVVCDATVNTPLRVSRNELWCSISIKPTKTAEWIIFEVNLTT